MPTCSKCGVTKATVEMRRSPKKGKEGETLWLCKLTQPCKERRRLTRIHGKAAKRASQI